MGTNDRPVVLRDGRHAAKAGPPGRVVHDPVHHSPDPPALVGLVDQPTDETSSIPEAAKKEVARKRLPRESTEHEERRICQRCLQRPVIEAMGLKIAQAIRPLPVQQILERAEVVSFKRTKHVTLQLEIIECLFRLSPQLFLMQKPEKLPVKPFHQRPEPGQVVLDEQEGPRDHAGSSLSFKPRPTGSCQTSLHQS